MGQPEGGEEGEIAEESNEFRSFIVSTSVLEEAPPEIKKEELPQISSTLKEKKLSSVKTEDDKKEIECPLECGDMGFNWQEIESYEFPLYDIVQTLVKTSDILNYVWHYGFYILGISKTDKNIISIGVPSYHGFDPHPFPYLHSIAIWVPEANCTSVYGDFGFWVIGIDLNINKYFSLM